MIDCHIHLDDTRYDSIRDNIVRDFEKDNISFVINSASDFKSIEDSVRLAERYKKVYATIGIHPNCCSQFDQRTIDEMEKYSTHDKVIAVGEVGLDYHYPDTNKKLQKEVFAQQIEMAFDYNLPLVLHIRDAWQDCLDILQAQRIYLSNGVMFHCYNGSEEITRILASKGFYFSVGGALTYMKRAYYLINAIPLDRIVTETDGPYLTPEPFRGKLNLPKYVKYILPLISDVYGISVENLEDKIEDNARRFFKKII